jgi:hypothetical protein
MATYGEFLMAAVMKEGSARPAHGLPDYADITKPQPQQSQAASALVGIITDST